MFTLSKTFVLAMFAVSASALTTHGAANYGRHHAIARNAVPNDTKSPIPVPRAMQKRGPRRCKKRPTSSTVAVPSSTIEVVTTSSKAPEPTTSSKVEAPTTSKAPEPTTSKAPEPTTTPVAQPTTTKPQTTAPPATTQPAGNLPSFMVGTQLGKGTYYAPGLGACGITNTEYQDIAAVSHLLFDNYPGYNGQNPNNNPMCGRTVTARRGSKSVVVALTDRCEACALDDLDFSPHAFDMLADRSLGRVDITWEWN